MTVRALLVDDEAPARSELRYVLGAHPEIEVVGEAATAREAVALAAAVRYDVVFLDVEMPGPTGLDLARVLQQRAERPLLVFVTAHERYAVQAFAVEAFDYVLKPVDPARLARVVERVVAARRPAAGGVEKVPVVSAGKTELVDYAAICFVQAEGDYTRVHTYDRAYLCTQSLRELEDTLPSSRFARIHRSYLVNLERVAAVSRAGADRLRLTVDDSERTQLDVARRQSRVLRERLRL